MLWNFSFQNQLRDIIAQRCAMRFPAKKSLPQESMRTTVHYPESPYGRTYADVITKISQMDSLPNYLSYGAPLARARSSANNPFDRDVLLSILSVYIEGKEETWKKNKPDSLSSLRSIGSWPGGYVDSNWNGWTPLITLNRYLLLKQMLRGDAKVDAIGVTILRDTPCVLWSSCLIWYYLIWSLKKVVFTWTYSHLKKMEGFFTSVLL